MPAYDVFFSYASADKPAVEALARRLRDEEELRVFFDQWELVPGAPWQEALEKALTESRTCAVFLGPQALGPWHSAEMRVALGQRVAAEPKRVIPVLLPGASSAVPGFLAQRTLVDFRRGLDDEKAYARLVVGVRGVATDGNGAGQGHRWRNQLGPFRLRALVLIVIGAAALAWLWQRPGTGPPSDPTSAEPTAIETPTEATAVSLDPAAGSPKPAAETRSRLGGNVVDADNRGVAGARVTVRGHAAGAAETDRDGRFELTVEAALGEQVRLHVEHPHFRHPDTYCFAGSLKCHVVLESPVPHQNSIRGIDRP